jgi:hypothetical protein
MPRSLPLFALAGVALCGCVVPPPSAPAVMALPSANKTYAQFQQEDAGCRQAASAAIGVTAPAPGAPVPPPVPVGIAGAMQEKYDTTYTQCMYSQGNKVTAPPAPPTVYASDPYYGYYSPYYYGTPYAYGPAFDFGFGYGYGGGYGGGLRGGYGERGGYGGGYGGYRSFGGGGGGGGGGFHGR